MTIPDLLAEKIENLYLKIQVCDLQRAVLIREAQAAVGAPEGWVYRPDLRAFQAPAEPPGTLHFAPTPSTTTAEALTG